MPSSMTGFGAADGDLNGGRLSVEIRTVNHRHLSFQTRLPAALQPLEDALREAVRGRLERGHVTVSARWTDERAGVSQVGVDLERARDIARVLTELKEQLGLGGTVDVGLVARQPDVLTFERPAEPDVKPEAFLAIVERALTGVIEMREREGAALAADLLRRLDEMSALLDRVRTRAPARVQAERDRLQAAVGELLNGRPVDETRLNQEIAFLAERLDITEEIVRLGTHLEAARAALRGRNAAGRRLGFLAQEMLREVNTIGSKANDAIIAEAVIAMKGELEKLREQLENLE